MINVAKGGRVDWYLKVLEALEMELGKVVDPEVSQFKILSFNFFVEDPVCVSVSTGNQENKREGNVC